MHARQISGCDGPNLLRMQDRGYSFHEFDDTDEADEVRLQKSITP